LNPSARSFSGIADCNCQAANGGGRVAVSIPFVRAALELRLGASLGFLDPRDEIDAMWHLSNVGVVLWSKLSQTSLHRVVVGGPIEVLLMQDQPELEARIGAPDLNPTSSHRPMASR
jgi:hypothetical protein